MTIVTLYRHTEAEKMRKDRMVRAKGESLFWKPNKSPLVLLLQSRLPTMPLMLITRPLPRMRTEQLHLGQQARLEIWQNVSPT